MSDVLRMQNDEPDAPAEEKGSYISIAGGCKNSYKSWIFC